MTAETIDGDDEIELTIVTLRFDAADPERLLAGAGQVRGAHPDARRAAATSTSARR